MINIPYEKYYPDRDVISMFAGAMGLGSELEKAGLNAVIGQDFEDRYGD